MKIAPRNADGFCRKPGAGVRVVLLYGPDQGLVRERSNLLLAGAVEDASDPFRVCELDGDDIQHNPARLMEEACALSLTGGRRVVRVRGATNGLEETVGNLLKLPTGDTLMLIEAGELAARSKLRARIERAEDAAAVACYHDDGRELGNVVADELRKHGLRADNDATRLLVSCLGGDRLQTRNEIAKLALYAGAGGHVTVRDVEDAVADSSFLSMDRIAHAVSSGNLDDLDRSLERALANREMPVSILGAVRRHMTQLELFLGLRKRGMAEDRALKSAGSRHFRNDDALKAAARHWDAGLVRRALDYLIDADIQCRTTGMPDATICRRALSDIARKAQGRRRPSG